MLGAYIMNAQQEEKRKQHKLRGEKGSEAHGLSSFSFLFSKRGWYRYGWSGRTNDKNRLKQGFCYPR